MKYLVDTHAFLWFFMGDRRLSRKARQVIENTDNERFLSLASLWEMAIKVSLGRLSLPSSLEDYIAEKLQVGFRLLSIEFPHIIEVATLPFHHQDPFDRLLVAQGIREKMPIVSGDKALRDYPVNIIW